MRLEGSGAFHQQEGIGAALFYFSSLLESSGSSGSKVWSLWIPSLFRLGNSDAPPGFMDSLSSCRIPSFPLSSIIYVGYFDQVSRFLASSAYSCSFPVSSRRTLSFLLPNSSDSCAAPSRPNSRASLNSIPPWPFHPWSYSLFSLRMAKFGAPLQQIHLYFPWYQIADVGSLDCHDLVVDAWLVLLFIIDEITSWGCAENSPNNISAMLNPCSWCFSFTNRCLD